MEHGSWRSVDCLCKLSELCRLQVVEIYICASISDMTTLINLERRCCCIINVVYSVPPLDDDETVSHSIFFSDT